MSDRDLIEWDWLDTLHGDRLHHATLSEALASELIEEGRLEPVQFACGATVTTALIPGFLSRLSVPRCARCCDALGYPRGIGSPKNDPACRPLVEARIGGGL